MRSLALANEFRDVYQFKINFAMRSGKVGFEVISRNGYSISISDEKETAFDYNLWLDEVIETTSSKILVLDVRDELSRNCLERYRQQGILIVIIDDASERRLSADLAFYPPVPQVKRLDWTSFTGKLYIGFKWVILHPQFSKNQLSKSCQNRLAEKSKKRILVTMGGSDPAALTLKALQALTLINRDFEVDVVLGPGFIHYDDFKKLYPNLNYDPRVHENLDDLKQLMMSSDFAITSFGVTAYELAAMGVPAIYLCLSQDHKESASALVREGAGIIAGLHSLRSSEELATLISNSLNDSERLADISNRAATLIDGKGSKRIAEIIVSLSKKRGLCN